MFAFVVPFLLKATWGIAAIDAAATASGMK
jgi:hypothetical protein